MKRTICIINLILLSALSLTAQNNFIVCGIPDLERDTYSDIPDTTIQTLYVKSGESYNSYNFDMDGNGGTDVKIITRYVEGEGGSASLSELISQSENITFAFGEQTSLTYGSNPSQAYYYNFPKAFNAKDTIDERYNFVQGNMLFCYHGGPWGNFTYWPGWLGIGEKYIGISLEKNDVTLYGYILVKVTGSRTVIIKEFAMNINPYRIVPGTTAQSFDLYPNPAKNEVFIKFNGENAGKPGTFTLYDLSGKKLLLVDDIPQNGHIALPEFAKGLYIAEIVVEGQRFTRKLQIE